MSDSTYRLKTSQVFLAIGSNLGERRNNINDAVSLLSQIPSVRLIQLSPLIQTDPVGGPPNQKPFLNGAIEISCRLTPLDLLDRLHNIELKLGRVRREKWGPRTIDLDILLFGSEIIQLQQLIIPHPRMAQRLFVLQPLAQIAPDAVFPITGKTVSELLEILLKSTQFL